MCIRDRHALWPNTLLVLLSDNGASAAGGSNAPLRGAKGGYFEGGVRTRALLAGSLLPQNVRGSSHEGLVHVADWAPTLLNAAGLRPDLVAGFDAMDGVDQWDAFVSGASAAASQRTHVAHNINSELFGAAGALRVGEYKLIVEARVTESEIYEYGQHMLQDDNWDQSELSQVIHQKLLRTPGTTSLFDVVANPNELDEEDCDDARSCRNLYDLDEFADVKATILEKWAELRDSTPESTEIWLDDGPLADPALFGGVWTPWRDDLGMPYATYQLATKTVHNTLGGDNKPKPAEAAAEASAEQTNAGHNLSLIHI